MSKFLLLTLCILLTIESINCIDCYSCISTENPDCINPEQHMERHKCNTDVLTQTRDYAIKLNQEFKKIFEVTIAENAIPLSCLKQVVKVRGKEVVLRGCQLPIDPQNQLNVCKKVFDVQNKINMHVMHCSLCDTDGCNSSSLAKLSIVCIVTAALFHVLRVLKGF